MKLDSFGWMMNIGRYPTKLRIQVHSERCFIYEVSSFFTRNPILGGSSKLSKWLGSPPCISHETTIWKGVPQPYWKGTYWPWLLNTLQVKIWNLKASILTRETSWWSPWSVARCNFLDVEMPKLFFQRSFFLGDLNLWMAWIFVVDFLDTKKT